MTVVDAGHTLGIGYHYNEVVQYDGKSYMVFYYSFKNLQRLLNRHKNSSIFKRIRMFFTRGFTDGHHIYALHENHWYSKLWHNRLIKHEIGHIIGLKHTWNPFNIMNPTFALRWTDKPMTLKIYSVFKPCTKTEDCVFGEEIRGVKRCTHCHGLV